MSILDSSFSDLRSAILKKFKHKERMWCLLSLIIYYKQNILIIGIRGIRKPINLHNKLFKLVCISP